MTYLKLLLFSLLSILGHQVFSQEPAEDWNRLKKASHQIGFCVYNTEMPFCNEHEAEKLKREEQAIDEEEIHYFIMKKEWAKQRIDNWAERQEQTKESGLIFFDIRQGKLPEGVKTRQRPYNAFLLFNLSDSIQFQKFRKVEDHFATVTVVCQEEEFILENVLWREFMTGRMGRLVKSASVNVWSENEIGLAYEEFRQAYMAFKSNFN